MDSFEFEENVSPERKQKLHDIVSMRQMDMVVLLENVTDPHNIGAVLRTCESVGVVDVYILFTDTIMPPDDIKIGTKSASGAKRWLRIHIFDDLDACLKEIRKKVPYLYGTHLGLDAKTHHGVDFTQSFCLVLGNEHGGISPRLAKELDGNVFIPQVGMVKSLNISVAGAVILYEAYRQRLEAGQYDSKPEVLFTAEKSQLLQHYLDMCHLKEKDYISYNYQHEWQTKQS